MIGIFSLSCQIHLIQHFQIFMHSYYRLRLGAPFIMTTVNYTTGRVDFNDSVHIVTVPAGQRVEDITVNIPIFDDEIDEADEGFVVLLEVVDLAVAPFVDLSTRNTALGRIDDNDCKYFVLCTYIPFQSN